MNNFRIYAVLRKNHIRLIVALILLAVVNTAYWFILKKEDEVTPEEIQTSWVQVQPQRIEQQLGLVGRIQAAEQETLSAPFAGIIREMAVQEGDPVRSGQVLMTLDPNLVEIQLRQAQAELLKAQKEVLQLRNWTNSPEVSRARRAKQAAKNSLEISQVSLHDTRQLFKRGIVARMEVDALIQQAQRQQEEWLNAEDEFRATEARGSGEERKIAEMELVNTQVRYQALKIQSEKQSLKAPFSGIVVRPEISRGKTALPQAGLTVNQGDPLLTVIGLNHIQVLTQVDETDLHLLKEGMPVQITGDGFIGYPLSGHVSAIALQSNSSDFTGTAARYDVTVSIDSRLSTLPQQIRLGMSARLAVVLYSNEFGIAIPPEAVKTNEDGSSWILYRQTPDAPSSKKNIETGRAVVQGIEVKGINAGYVSVPK